MGRPPVTVVFGARNVGRAIAGERLEAGGRVLAVARSSETLERLRERHPAVETLQGDAADHALVERALRRAVEELGGLDLVVNAITAPPRDHSFGGGPIVEAPPERLDAWLAGFVPAAWAIQRAAGAALAAASGGTLVQVAGGSARRPIATRVPWGAAQHAARALTLGLAQELRPVGVHVALLIADGTIETERAPMTDRPERDSLAPEDVAAAVAYLAAQRERGWTHELTLTPAGDTWVP
ncbi:MAG TPA: SDR family NAD(P)-dependent oxidoreductase [Miltoncostaeaceae bacterium]|nr:SDR family NAD(P)-dependent oxidoreductase [Miltoncostaeaceae bacterium]